MIHLIYAKDPIWGDQAQSVINITVRFAHIDEELPFTASPNDPEAYGRDLYERALAGEFGVIADWAAPSNEDLANMIRMERDSLLSASDWTQLPDVPQTLKDAWAVYRQALRDIPLQSGFPTYVVWPMKPE